MDNPSNPPLPQAQLDQLHRELAESPALDERGREILAEVHRDIRRFDDAPPAPDERDQIQNRWQSAVVEFEGSHPQLAQGLEQMANILSNFGL